MKGLIPFGWDPFGDWEQFGSMLPAASRSFVMPKVDVQESKDSVIVKADIPGVDAEKIDVQVGDDALTISAQITEEKENKGEHFYRKERSSRSFARTVALPCPVKHDGIKAVCQNGTLTVTLPKAGEHGPKFKKIPVEAK